MRMQSRMRRRGSGRHVVAGSLLGIALLVPALVLAQPLRRAPAYGVYGTYGGAGTYVSVGVGQSTMNDAGTALLGVTVDNTDSAVKLAWGYMFDPNVGVEVGFNDFGTFLGALPREEWSASGVDISVLGALPIPDRYSRFSLFGKVGANLWSVDDNVPSLGGVASASGTNLSYGVGAQLDFNRQLGANVQWERFSNVGDPAITGRSDIDLVTLNLVYHFGFGPY